MAGWTGPGGKTVLPHRAVAKLDLRLVPDMTFDGAVAALKAHLAKRGFGDIEVNPSGGYDPTARPRMRRSSGARWRCTSAAASIRSSGRATRARTPATCSPASRCKLPAAHFGLGHGGGAHAPDEYFVIESSNPKVRGWDGAVRSYVDYLYELASAK